MAIVRRGPGGLELPELFRRFFNGEPSGLTSGWLPVEEYRNGDELVIRSETPGIDPERDVELTVSDGMLQVRVRREERNEQKGTDEYRSEFRYGEFVRALPLPPGVKEEDIKASYKDGILEIRVPIGAETESSVKRIPVARS
jgi:HSP20 family protein